MSTVVEHIDNVALYCGYFTGDTTVNNGYGCKHPDQEEKDTDFYTGETVGKCYCFSCPLGNCADEEDFMDHGLPLEDFAEGDYLVLDAEWKSPNNQ